MCSVARGKTWAGQDVDQRLVGVEGRFVGVRDLARRLVLETGRDEHRIRSAVEPLVAQVSDIGDVLDLEDVDAVVEQGASDEVGQDVAAQVADMGVAVDGRTAGVHPDPARLERLDRFDAPAQGVAQVEGHRHRQCYPTSCDGFVKNLAIAPNDSRRSSLSHQRPRGPNPIVPPAVWTCEASYRARRNRPATRVRTEAAEPSGSAGGGHLVTRPILPAMRRLFVLLVAATLFASCGGQTAAGPDRPVRILAGEPDDARPGRPGRRGECRDHGPALRVADQLRCRPPGPSRPRRIVALQRRRPTGHVPSPPGPDLLRRQRLAAIRRGAQLAAPDRSSPAVAAGLARPRHRRRRGIPARRVQRPASVGLRADDGAGDLVVDLVRPATDFVNIVAGPTFSVVPPGVGESAAALTPGPDFVASGGYVLSGEKRHRPDADRRTRATGRGSRRSPPSNCSATWAGADRSTPSPRATSTTPRSSGSTPRGWPTTRRSARSSGWSTRCRSSTTAST